MRSLLQSSEKVKLMTSSQDSGKKTADIAVIGHFVVFKDWPEKEGGLSRVDFLKEIEQKPRC